MIGSQAARKAYEEGAKARAQGLEAFDSPYSFIWETPAAYAWEEGFKKAK